MEDIDAIAARYRALTPFLDEQTRRLIAAAESQTIGRGGISLVARATGISRPVIRQGIAELKDPGLLVAGRVRRQGGGRKRAVDKDSSLKSDLEALLEATTRWLAVPADSRRTEPGLPRGAYRHRAMIPGRPKLAVP